MTAALMVALFAIDVVAKPPVSIGALYGFAIYLSAVHRKRSRVWGTAIACVLLTIVGFMLAHGATSNGDALFRCIYGIVLELVILLMVLRGMIASQLLLDQAKLLDQTHDSVVVRSLDATLLYWNLGAVNLFGWTFEEARKHSQAQLIGSGTTLPPMPIEEFVDHGPWHGEIVVFSKDGRRMVIDCRCSLLYDAAGRPTAILTTGNDVTEREEATSELRRSEIRYRNIFQTTGIGIWECDFSAIKERMDVLMRNGVTDIRAYIANHPDFIREMIDSVICVDVNEASVRMFAVSAKQELLGPVGWLWPKESETAFAQSVLAARLGEPSFETEALLNTRDGRRPRFFMSTAYPPESASRESVFVTVTDITARAEAQAALQSAQADLAHATRLTSLGELAASMAHEVNQPIAGMLASGQAGLRWLRRDVPDLGAVEGSLEHLVSEAKRAREIVSGIRALARNEMPRPEELDLTGLVEETLRLVGYELHRNGVVVATRLDRALPPVVGDRIQVQQVLINLLLNATQAMAALEGGEREIVVSCLTGDSGALVTIADTGPGVARSVQDRLFTAFTSTRSEGMGLGLSVCASIVKRHGGRIWLDADFKGGALFAFSIPFASDVAREVVEA